MSEQDIQLFSAWLEGQLTAQQRIEFEARMAADDDFARQVQMASQADLQAQDYAAKAVPDWPRENTWPQSQKTPWWQRQWLPAASMAMSVLAVCLVVFQVEVQVQGSSVTLSFAGAAEQQRVETLVEEKLLAFEQAQDQEIDGRLAALQQQQLTTNAQLTNYVLQSSRQERREDFAQFIQFINQQRSDDQLFYARQINQLEQQLVESSPRENWWPPVGDPDVNQ